MTAAIVIGVCATLLMDLWNLFLGRAFGIPSLDYALLGRWVLHMPAGRFRHASIAKAEPRSAERAVGWMSHYAIGISLAVGFILVATSDRLREPDGWLARPTLGLPLLYGIVTLVFPWFVMQPAMGFGVASAKAARPWSARLKSLGTHLVFGVGMYLTALIM